MFNFRNPIKTVVNTTIGYSCKTGNDVKVVKAIDVSSHAPFIHRHDKVALLYGLSSPGDELLVATILLTSRDRITDAVFDEFPDPSDLRTGIDFIDYSSLTMSYPDYCAMVQENAPVIPLAS